MKMLSIRTDRSEQTVQTMIRLLLKEQSDQGLHCLPFHPHALENIMACKTLTVTIPFLGGKFSNYFEVVSTFRIFTVIIIGLHQAIFLCHAFPGLT